VWIDNYEGGEAYIEDWEYLDEFETFNLAYQWIIDNYGELTEIN